MPHHRRAQDKGNLYIKFEIIFPPNNFVDPAKITVRTTAYCAMQSVLSCLMLLRSVPQCTMLGLLYFPFLTVCRGKLQQQKWQIIATVFTFDVCVIILWLNRACFIAVLVTDVIRLPCTIPCVSSRCLIVTVTDQLIIFALNWQGNALICVCLSAE